MRINHIHSFNTHIFDNNVYNYYNNMKNIYSYLNHIEVPLPQNQRITNDVRPICNQYVLLGAIEGCGTKCFVINPSAIYHIPRLPLIYLSDGMKTWLSGWWTSNISFVPQEQLVKNAGIFVSDRMRVNGDIVTKNSYIPLDDEYKTNMIKYIVENDKLLFGDH